MSSVHNSPTGSQQVSPLSSPRLGRSMEEIVIERVDFPEVEEIRLTPVGEAAELVRDLAEQRLDLRNGYYGDILEAYKGDKDRATVQAELKGLRANYESQEAELFEAQKVALKTFVKSYNAAINPDPALLASLQQLAIQQDAGNSSSVIAEGRVQMLQAVYERRFELQGRKLELDAHIATKWWDLKARIQRWKVECKLNEFGTEAVVNPVKDSKERVQQAKNALVVELGDLTTHGEMLIAAKDLLTHPNAEVQPLAQELIDAITELHAIEKELGAAPTPAYLLEIDHQIRQSLAEPPVMLSIKRAKQLQKRYDRQLAWGIPAQKRSLANPSNWTSIRRFALKTHHSGHLYASITELELAGDPVPSTMRKKMPTKATNLWRETHYILGQESRTTSVKFRHGQFPTAAAAKQALEAVRAAVPNAGTIHINSLLTPTRLGPDHKLLTAHKASVEQAVVDMGADAPTVLLSNFGVNDGAVGTLKILGLSIRLGWQTSIRDYTNDAVDQLNTFVDGRLSAVRAKLERHEALDAGDEALLHNLDGIIALSQRMNAIWSKNRYAYGEENQFEMTALWSALDTLIGIVTMTNCMSGKDRTGEVSSESYTILDEIYMDLYMRDIELIGEDRILFGSGLTKAEVVGQRIIAGRTADLPIGQARDLLLSNKVGQAQKILGGDEPFIARKKMLPGAYLMPGVTSISEEAPLTMPRHTFYTPDKAINRQRDAENRRQNALGTGMLRINQKNTGRAGTKLKATEAKVALHCGFDIDYVLANLGDWARLVKLDELGPNYKGVIERRWDHEDKRALLKEVALEKTKMLRPMGKVEA